jgi:hypothetical protein
MAAVHNVWQRALLGAAIGAGFAVLPTGAIAVLLLLDGRHIQLTATVLDGVSALWLYPLGAVLMGSLFGLLSPLTRWAWTSILAGMVAIAPLVGAVYLSVEGSARGETGLIALAMIVILGGAVGFGLRDRPSGRRQWRLRRRAG